MDIVYLTHQVKNRYIFCAENRKAVDMYSNSAITLPMKLISQNGNYKLHEFEEMKVLSGSASPLHAESFRFNPNISKQSRVSVLIPVWKPKPVSTD